MVRAASLMCAVLALGACGKDEPVYFERVSLRGTLPAETALECLRGWSEPAGATVAPGEEPGAFRIELALPPSAWTPSSETVWRASANFGFDLRRLEGKACTLSGEGVDLAEIDSEAFEEKKRGYLVEASTIAVQLDPGEPPPGAMTLRVRYFFAKLSPGAEGSGAVWRPFVGGHTGEGFPVPSGTHVEIEADIFPEAFLRFYAVAEPLGLGFDGLEECGVTYVVELDGEPVFEHEAIAGRLGFGDWHEVALPAEGRRGGRLRFSVRSELPCSAAFLSPSIGPATATTRARDPRPDLMLVLLDTLRADALSFYGGDPDVAPRLNAFAEDCVRFRRAWSNASWTLPSQSSMLSGLQPEQHGATSPTNTLPGSVVTLAEHLRAQGYRTVATTEALFVARRYGMDQGFEFFFENRRRKFKRTLAAADDVLGSDDGRPTFFFLHTYRVHTPYRLGAEEDREPMRRFIADWEAWKSDPEADPGYAVVLGDRLRGLYYGGVTGLDVVFGPWLEDLAGSGWFDNGYLLMTSDHGEALQEHGVVGHGGRHWEERIRIPMFARGPGLAPGIAEPAVTLVDLAPTFSRLAGVEPHPSWVGDSIFEVLDRSDRRIVFTFNSKGDERAITAHDLDRKVVAPMDMQVVRSGDPIAVFDLASDPDEEQNLFRNPPEWARDMLRSQAEVIGTLLEATVAAEEIELTEEERAELKALGYTGD